MTPKKRESRKPSNVAIAREVAFDVLRRVASGAYASDLLFQATAGLDSRDAGLAGEITLGVLRRQAQLDWLISRQAKRPVSKLDVEVAIALRMALHQIYFLDRVPVYAAVNDSLNLLRGARKVSAIAFANAVLRQAGKKTRLPDLAVPEWLLNKWTVDFGAETAEAIAHASLETPHLYQRVPAGCPPPENAKRTEIDGCWEVENPDPRFRIQDIGSQSIVPLLELQPQGRFLDVCSAPGNKTAQAAEVALRIVACDISHARLQTLRLPVPRVLLDATRPLPFAAKFDKILVDAPCSGTGTLGHNPEIKWRLKPEQLQGFAERQGLILRNALEALAPNGTLVYSTCSLEKEENEDVARAVAGGRIIGEIRRFPGRDPGDGFYAAVIR